MPQKRVLIVDDEWDNLECLQELLQQEFAVVAACGGDAAVECLLAEPFDAVLLDLTMPDIDGFAVMQFIKRRFPWLPVMLTSGLPQLAEIASEIGASDWMSKPCHFEELPRRLRRLMGVAEPQTQTPEARFVRAR
jgi:DNA-binding response OmpR family regulator